MAGEKGFTDNVPRTGRQRSAEQVTARITDVLNYINEFFIFTGDPLNRGKVFGINAEAPNEDEITVFNALTLDDPIMADHVVVGDIAPNEGSLVQEWAVIGDDQKYKIGPIGSTGQIATLDALGNIIFTNPPASTNFIDQNGNFTVTPNVNYNIEAGVTITINDTDVVPGFVFKIRPQRNQNFEANNPVITYNGTNPFQNQSEDLNVDKNLEYTFFSQDGVTLQITADALSKDI